MQEDFENKYADSEESDSPEEKLSELESRLDELETRLDDIECKADDLEDLAEDTATDVAEDMLTNFYAKEQSRMILFSQDKKLISPFLYVEAFRIKKGEEPYTINIRINNSNGRRVGTYPNKEAALAEMARIAAALRDGKTYYEMQ